MNLDYIERKLNEIGIYGFRDFESEIITDPLKLKIVFELDFEHELFADDCDKFWDFFTKNTGITDIDNLMFEFPMKGNLLFEYENTVLEVYGPSKIIYTSFYQYLYRIIYEYLDNIWEEFVNL